MLLSVLNKTKQKPLADQVRVAKSLTARAIGLLGTASLPPGAGLYLRPCKSIHTFFMRYPIDVLFIDGKGLVLHQATLPPWRMSRWEPKAEGVLELSAGTLERTGTQVGDMIEMTQEAS